MTAINTQEKSVEKDTLKMDTLTKGQLLRKYPDLFKGLRTIGQPVSFVFNNMVTPVYAPVHRIPTANRKSVKKKLDEMVTIGNLKKVEEPRDKCSNMTVVEKTKPNVGEKICICLDPSQMMFMMRLQCSKTLIDLHF